MKNREIKIRKIKPAVIFICALAAVNIAFAETDDKPSKDETRFKLSGIVETGVDVISKVNRDFRDDVTEIRPIARGEIDISARPVKGVRAEIGLEYNQRDTFVTIDKFYGQYSVSDNVIRAGIMKKAFGMEERAGLDERYFRSRSIIRDGLRDEGFLSHDLTLQYRRGASERWRFIGGLSMAASAAHAVTGATDSLRYFQNYSAHYRRGGMDVVAAAVIQHFHYVPSDWFTTAFAASLSCRHTVKSWWISESELTFGSSMRARIPENKDVFILGVRKQEQFAISTGLKTLRQVVPVIEAALYWDDLESESFETQIRGGLTFGFAKNNALQFRNTFGTIMQTSSEKTTVRRYRFDSEVVVIF